MFGYWMLLFGMSLMTIGFSIDDTKKIKDKKEPYLETEWEEERDGQRIFYDKNGKIKKTVKLLNPHVPPPVSRWN